MVGMFESCSSVYAFLMANMRVTGAPVHSSLALTKWFKVASSSGVLTAARVRANECMLVPISLDIVISSLLIIDATVAAFATRLFVLFTCQRT